MRDAFVLGAGFSAAISDHMPVLSTLGQRVWDRLPASSRESLPSNLGTDRFEDWLSFLAVEQPWLSERETLLNRAAFVTVAEEMRFVLAESEDAARSSSPPDWLLQLVARWHRDRAVVITLNYDSLVELAYTSAVRVVSAIGETTNYVSYEQIYGVPISPAGSRLGAWISAGDVETFRLLKLHGSLNWRYSGSISAQGETIYDSGLPKTWSGDRPTDRMTRAAQDKVPFIVPPTAVKSGFFSNETVRAQWLAARRELARADRVFCIGYSMPPTDQMMATMLADTTRGKQVSVIDRSAATIDRYRATLRAASAVSLAAAGESAVQDFVRGYDGSEWTVPESITV